MQCSIEPCQVMASRSSEMIRYLKDSMRAECYVLMYEDQESRMSKLITGAPLNPTVKDECMGQSVRR